MVLVDKCIIFFVDLIEQEFFLKIGTAVVNLKKLGWRSSTKRTAFREQVLFTKGTKQVTGNL